MKTKLVYAKAPVLGSCSVVVCLWLILFAGIANAQQKRVGLQGLGCQNRQIESGETARTSLASGIGVNTGGPTCTNLILAGGFETGGIPSSIWDPETSTLFCTPVCNLSQCGTGGGVAGPSSGTFWVWFGDVGAAEEATIGQTVTIPSGSTATLTFQLRIGRVASPFEDVMHVKVDGVIRATFLEPSVAETSYSLRTLDLTPFADGAPHQILFHYIHLPSDGASFSLDDVALNVCPQSQTPRRSPFDFDGDSKTDIGITRQNAGDLEWWLSRSSDANVFVARFGLDSDIPVPTDFTGDGKADIAIFRSTSGQWFILRSEDFSYFSFPFGTGGDIPMPADYDNDGKSDPAVFRPSQGLWFILQTGGGGVVISQFGTVGDLPIVSDYDGDGKADVGIIRDNAGNREWWIQRSSLGVLVSVFGVSGDLSVPGDYTGDGKSDIAIFRPSSGQWFVLRSEDFSYFAFPWGTTGDIPAPGDYDGDGKFDSAVFRPSTATWFVNRTGGSGHLFSVFGVSTDRPVPNVFVR